MENIQQRREGFDQKPLPYSHEQSVSMESVTINEVNCCWFTPDDPDPRRIILYLHGGGFALGSVRSHGRMISHFAHRLRSRVLFIDYGLAPERPFPAGIKDVVRVYRGLITLYSGSEIVFIGDSAGGGLIVSVVGEMLKKSIPLPLAAVLISPWISLARNKTPDEENGVIDSLLTDDTLRMFARIYTGDSPLEVSSPENVRLRDFPPVLVMVGTNDTLLDDSRHFYDKIKSIQPKSRLSIYDDQPHVWPRKDVHSEASQRALAEIEGFLRA